MGDPTEFQHQLDSNCLQWTGYTAKNRPILIAQPGLRDQSTFDVKKEIQMHIHLLEYGINNLMPEGVDDFVIVAAADQVSMWDVTCVRMFQLLRKLMYMM